MEFKRITSNGKATFMFDRNMVIPPDWEAWNGTSNETSNPYFDIKIEPGVGQDVSFLGFNWTVTEFTEREMVISFNFWHAIRISMADTKDKLSIGLMMPERFLDQKMKNPVKKSRFEPKFLPGQMP